MRKTFEKVFHPSVVLKTVPVLAPFAVAGEWVRHVIPKSSVRDITDMSHDNQASSGLNGLMPGA